MEISSRVVPITECEASRRGPLVAQLDGDAIGRKLVARCPEPGDRMQPLGMAGTKKLHDVFVDRKIPRADREGIPVVQAIDGEIVWLVGHYISERAKVTESTGTVIELYARPLA